MFPFCIEAMQISTQAQSKSKYARPACTGNLPPRRAVASDLDADAATGKRLQRSAVKALLPTPGPRTGEGASALLIIECRKATELLRVNLPVWHHGEMCVPAHSVMQRLPIYRLQGFLQFLRISIFIEVDF